MKKVLMIIYSYPSAHDLRFVKFVKYIHYFDWEPYVISAKGYVNEDEKRFLSTHIKFFKSKDIFNKTYIKLPQTNSKIIRSYFKLIRCFSWFINSAIGTAGIGWIPFVLNSVKKLIQKENIDLIYSAGLPPSCIFLGVILKTLTKKPLVVDFPDAWTLDPYRLYPTEIHRRLDQVIESRLLDTCDRIIFATQSMAEDYLRIYPWLREKVRVIRNGFDIEDMPKKEIRPFNDKFTITYTGRFYGLRSPEPFLKALYKILKDNEILRQEFRVLFVGSKDKNTKDLVKRYGLQDIVTQLGWVPLSKSFEYMFKSHLLLLIEPTSALTTKAFEYLATGKPILAIIPEGELAELIREYSDNSYIIASDSIEDIASAIIDAYKKWKKGELVSTNRRKVRIFKRKFNRKNLAGDLAKVFDEVINWQMR